MWPLASFLADTVQQFSLTAAGQLPCLAVALWVVAAGRLPSRTLLGCGHWPASPLPVLLWPLASFLIVTVPFAAAGQLPHCQCSLCDRWPASSLPVFPLRPLASLLALLLLPTSFFFFFFFFLIPEVSSIGLTAKLCIFSPACLSREACSCRESTRVVGLFRKGVGSGVHTFIMPAISTMAQVWWTIIPAVLCCLMSC